MRLTRKQMRDAIYFLKIHLNFFESTYASSLVGFFFSYYRTFHDNRDKFFNEMFLLASRGVISLSDLEKTLTQKEIRKVLNNLSRIYR